MPQALKQAAWEAQAAEPVRGERLPEPELAERVQVQVPAQEPGLVPEQEPQREPERAALRPEPD